MVVGVNSLPAGAEQSPYGQARSFAMDVIREAALRAGMAIEWREVRGARDAEQLLDRGEIDVFPTALESSDRRERYYVSTPWWHEQLALVMRADGPTTERVLAGRPIVLASGLALDVARQAFSQSIIRIAEPEGNRQAVIPVCQGQAAAALLTHRDADATIAGSPPECAGVPLTLIDVQPVIGIAIMTTKEKARIGERLRRRIDELTEDGTLTRFARSHPGVPAASAAALAERMREKSRRRVLELTLAGVLAVAALGLVHLFRMRSVQKALASSEHQYRSLFESMQEGFAVCDIICDGAGRPVDWRYIEVNPAFAAAAGLPASSMSGRTYRELFPDTWSQYWVDGLGRVALTREPMRLQNESAGGRYYEALAYSPRPGRFAAVFSDVTERRAAEDALRHSEAKLRALFQSLIEAVLLLNPRGEVEEANDSAAAMCGCTVAELKDPASELSSRLIRSDGTPFPIADQPATLALRTGQSVRNVELGVPRLDGSVSWTLVNAQPVRDQDGNLLGAVASFFDITERKLTEEALRMSNHDLQAYAYTVSHDLQEPLRMVSAYIDLLARRYGDSLDERSKEYMDIIRTGALRMDTMLADLLLYSRAGQDSLPPAAVDANAAARHAVDALRRQVEETGAQIVVEELPVVQAWEGRLDQVFQNLIGNALKYRRPEEAPRVHIEATAMDAQWRFSITDNGIGFDMEYSERIFRVFQRLHARSEYSGNGIGLAISKRIVERHGGRIWVEWSEPGKGSRFCFTLPARRLAADPSISTVAGS